MNRIKGGFVAIQKSGEIIGFDSHEEYADYRKTPESKEVAWLFASTKYVIQSLMSGSDAEGALHEIRGIIDRWNNLHLTEERALDAIYDIVKPQNQKV